MYLPLPASHLLIHLERGPGGGGGHPQKIALGPSSPLLDHPWKKMSGYAHVYYYSFCVYLHYTLISSCSQLLCNTVNSQKNA